MQFTKKTAQYLFKFIIAGVTGISENPLCPNPYEYNNPARTVVGREMTMEDIKSIQNDYIEAARRAYEAGYDGVELHGCHGYLITIVEKIS